MTSTLVAGGRVVVVENAGELVDGKTVVVAGSVAEASCGVAVSWRVVATGSEVEVMTSSPVVVSGRIVMVDG